MKQKKACTCCGGIGTLERIKKPWWMRLLLNGEYFRCFICNYRFFEWSDIAGSKQNEGRNKEIP